MDNLCDNKTDAATINGYSQATWKQMAVLKDLPMGLGRPINMPLPNNDVSTANCLRVDIRELCHE